jgi:hypothetical protein
MVIVAISSFASGQYYFGKNKVHYKDFQYSNLATDHFRIYFYSGGERLGEFASKILEEAYTRLSQEFSLQFDAPVPVILYNSPNDFSQTNVTLDLIEEGVGGFSELFKNRMVIPFDGSYYEFHHVLVHELTHIFQYKLFYQDQLSSILSLVPAFTIPLWVMEGSAEFLSEHTSLEADNFIQDLVISGRLLTIDQLNGDESYLVYKEGQAVFLFIEDRYGRKKVFEFFHTLKLKKNFDEAVRSTFGLATNDFSNRFTDWLKIRYYPKITRQENFNKIATLLIDHKKDRSMYNTGAVLSPSGTKIAYISDKSGYGDVYVISAIDGRVLRHLVRGERFTGFEAIPLLQGGLTWASDERSLIVITKDKGHDIIMVVDYPTGRIKRKFNPNLDGVANPNFAPDGERIVFSGMKDGFADIYLLNIRTGVVSRLGYDIYEDRDPAFTPDGKDIVFVSDRPDTGIYAPGSYGIYFYNNGDPKPITAKARYYAHPVCAPDGNALYCVRGDSCYHLCRYSLPDGRLEQSTDFLGNVYFPSIDSKEHRLTFIYFNSLGFDIGTIADPKENLPRTEAAVAAYQPKDYYTEEGLEPNKIKPYRVSFAPDYAVGGVGYSTGAGVAGNVNIAVSDLLGNHRFWLIGDLLSDIRYSDIYLYYWYLAQRVYFGATGFQYFNRYLLNYDSVYVEEGNRGLGLSFAYPFNKFMRIEWGGTGVSIENSIYQLFPNGDFYRTDHYFEKLFLFDAAFVMDNALWGATAPVRGQRTRFEAYSTVPGISDRTYYTGLLDFRHYFYLAPRFTLAAMFLGLASAGSDAEVYYLGDLVRGYGYYELTGSKIGLAKLELRFPFIDRLKIAFPLPLEFSSIGGVMFADVGAAWTDSVKFYDSALNPPLQDLKVGVGAGVRIQVYYFLFKFDWSKPLSQTDDKSIKFHFGLGADF